MSQTKDLAIDARNAGLSKSTGIAGIEGMGGRHLVAASIVLVQGTSSHFTTKGILPGKFANTLTEEQVNDTEFVPAYLTEKQFVYKYEDEPKCQKKSLDFVADNLEDPRLSGRRTGWGGDGLKPEVIPTIILAAILGGKPIKVSFKGASSYGAGMKLYTLSWEASKELNLPLWGVKYKLVSYPAKNRKGDNYFKMDVVKSGIPEDKERLSAAELSDVFKSQSKAQIQELDVPF